MAREHKKADKDYEDIQRLLGEVKSAINSDKSIKKKARAGVTARKTDKKPKKQKRAAATGKKHPGVKKILALHSKELRKTGGHKPADRKHGQQKPAKKSAEEHHPADKKPNIPPPEATGPRQSSQKPAAPQKQARVHGHPAWAGSFSSQSKEKAENAKPFPAKLEKPQTKRQDLGRAQKR